MGKVYKENGQTVVVSADGTHRVVLGWGKGYPIVELPKSTVDGSVMKPEAGQPDPHDADLLEDAPADDNVG